VAEVARWPVSQRAMIGVGQAGAISRDARTEPFRRGEVLLEGRSMDKELALIAEGASPTAAKQKV
jgi:hypothetical protein